MLFADYSSRLQIMGSSAVQAILVLTVLHKYETVNKYYHERKANWRRIVNQLFYQL